MKVVHISTSDRSGGAAIAAFRLNEAMCAHQIDSKMLVYQKKSNNNNVISVSGHFLKLRYLCHFYLSLVFKRLVLKAPFAFSFGLGKVLNISRYDLLLEADVIYIHFVNCGFLNLNEIDTILSLGKPVIFFMHDMWLLTGGCHHSFECTKYVSHCYDCPNIAQKQWKNIVAFNFKEKNKKISFHPNVYIVAPSLWLTNCAKNSGLFKEKKVSCIPNLLNTNIFRPTDKQKAREYYNLPLNKKLILFGADGGSKNRYKGWQYLKEALLKIDDLDVEVVVFGNKLDNNAAEEIPFTTYSVGHIANIESLVLLYNAVDVFVTPSLAEAFGQTVFESQACGTLVVGFDVGGIPDLIKHLKTGYLAKYMDSTDLALGIKWALANKEDISLTNRMRKYVIDHFSYEVVVQKHLNMWQSISCYHK